MKVRLTSFDEVLAAVAKLPETPGLGWSLAHCAQSIDFARTGYPKPRAWLVRAVIGPMVLKKFLRQGAMSHDVAAPIPGASELGKTLTVAEGRARLEAAIAAFRAHTGTFAPHFAYGPVSRDDYERVQAMHVGDHLRAL
ncbi:MAG: DUF1569 domain-containing protein [Archangium sp.]|nr:DUF1569 domain-containing protein [Archangium sp.]